MIYIVKEFTHEKINDALGQAVEIAKDKKHKDSQKMNDYLEKLRELRVIDSEYKVITSTKAEKPLNIQNPLIQSVSAQSSTIPSFDLRGKCITNAGTMSSTYNVNYYVGLVLYGNPISAAAYAYSTTGVFFTSKVKTGGEWDYKAVLGTNTVYKVIIDDYTYYYTGECIGNFHYGYTGAVVYPDTILLSAAGLVQIISGTSDISFWSSYFDDPIDQTYIQSGIDCYRDGTI